MLREESRWQTHFGQWVTDIGVSSLTERLHGAGIPVTRNAVYNWLAGARAPRPEAAIAMTEISGGSISLVDIYLHPLELRRRAS